jgi:homoserine acetyltransferase
MLTLNQLSQFRGQVHANDFLYYVNASRNYNPEPKLNTITAPVLWINSADDFINPPELGIAEKMVTSSMTAWTGVFYS